MISRSHKIKDFSRRQFLKTSGGITFGILAGSVLPGCTTQDIDINNNPFKELTAFVNIQPEGSIRIFSPAAEMGQGSMTSLAVIIAEEMDAKWSDIIIEHAPILPDTYGMTWGYQMGGPMITVGSRTVMGYFENLRIAGAEARYVLMKNAAEHWEIPIEELTTNESKVVHEATNRKISYQDISSFAKEVEIPKITTEKLKDPSEFKLIGKVNTRIDIPEKVEGTALYAVDIHLPGMVYGVITRSPAHGTSAILKNASEIQNIEGVLDIITLDHGIGIVADTIESALRAKSLLNIEWRGKPHSINHTSDKDLKDYRQSEVWDKDGDKLTDKGNVSRALGSAYRTYSIEYFNDYVYHCQMEPLNAVVSMSADKKSADIWAGTQYPDGAKRAAAKVLGLSFNDINFHPCYLGGGFGRRSMSDYIEEACMLAKKIDKPLKLMWTREDDIQYGAFRPQSLQSLEAGVDRSGNINSWKHIIVGPGDNLLGSGARTAYYNFPNQLVEVKSVDHGIRTKHWRAVGHGPNKWAIEAFIDEIAADLEIDPLEYRMFLMKDYPRAQNVIQRVAKMANWGRPVAEGRAFGLAFAERSRSLSAGIAEISVDKNTGIIRVHHFWAAIDAGIVVQPDNVIAQMEGGIIMGISSALKERINFVNGEVQQSNYHDYPVLKMSEVPDAIDIEIIDSLEPPTGVGESGIPIVGGAIANAFGNLTGKRIRHMPFTSKKVLHLLQS